MKIIIAKWPSVRAFADDVGVPYTTAASWGQNDMIPARYDARIVEASIAHGAPVTLAEIAEARANAFRERGAA